MKTFRAFLSIILFSLMTVNVGLTQSTMDAPVRFVVLGDRTGGHVPGIFGQVCTEVQRLRPNFVTMVGDMIEGYTDDSVRIKTEWAEFDSLCEIFTMPFYRTVGNHDILDSTDEYWYQKLVGEPYYSYDHGGLHFISIDNPRWDSTSEFMSDEANQKQIDWLIADLEKNQDAAYTFVYMHIPFWYFSLSNGRPDSLHSLFKKYGVDAVFTGHFHDYFVGEYDGIIYTGVGSSGGHTNKAPNGLFYHYAWVTVDNDGIHIAPIKYDAVLAWDAITVEEMKTYDPIERRGLRFTKPAVVGNDLTFAEASIEMTLDNSSSDYPLKSEVKWDIPEGWSIEPVLTEVEAAPGEIKTIPLTAYCSGKLFPTPTAEAVFTYSENKTVKAEGYVKVCRQADCMKAKKVKIDGTLEDECWAEAQTVLFNNDGSPMQTEPVRFFFAYDKKNLYLGAFCEESVLDSIKADADKNDGAVYADDCVGYFIEPAYGLDTLYQIYINPDGIVYDAKYWIKPDGYLSGTTKWNGDYEIATMQVDDGWIMEARIPMKQFGMTLKEGDKIRLNFRRKQQHRNAAADWQLPLDWDANTYGELNLK